jgi:oligopeptide transport system substrate-binding protein
MSQRIFRVLVLLSVACIPLEGCRSGTEVQAGAAEPRILRLSMGSGDMKTLDPALADDVTSTRVVREMFVGLTRDDEQTGAILPGMAESWDIAEDGRAYTFHLRSGIPWVAWDGSSVVEVRDCQDPPAIRMVTAEDFVYGIRRTLDPDTGASYAYVLANAIEGAEAYAFGGGVPEDVRVKATDPFTLEIVFKQNAAYNPAIIGLWFASAQPKWLIEGDACTQPSQDRWTEPGRSQSYGPFALASWIHDASLAIVRNPYWPGIESSPQARIDEVSWVMVDEAGSLSEYEMGNLDSVAVPMGDVDRIRTHPIYSKELVIAPILCSTYYAFNTQAAFVDDARVRRALSLAIDRRSLMENVAEFGQEPARWFARPGLDAAPTLEQFPDLGIGFDPEAAKRELQDYLKEKGRTPADLDLTMMFTNIQSEHKFATAVQAMWQEQLGLEVKLDSQEWNFYLDTINHPEHTPQIFVAGWCADYPDANNFTRDVFAKGGAANPADGGGVNWLNPEFERLVAQAALERDRQVRTRLYAEAEEILVVADAVIAPLFWGSRMTLTKPYVERTFGVSGLESFEKWDILPSAEPTDG